jgi:hypothetical protein
MNTCFLFSYTIFTCFAEYNNIKTYFTVHNYFNSTFLPVLLQWYGSTWLRLCHLRYTTTIQTIHRYEHMLTPNTSFALPTYKAIGGGGGEERRFAAPICYGGVSPFSWLSSSNNCWKLSFSTPFSSVNFILKNTLFTFHVGICQ